jgi:hypothetical protein
MKIFALLLAAILAGTAVGVGSMVATYRTAYGRLTPDGIFPPRLGEGETFVPGETPKGPFLTVDNEHYDFGVLENGEEGEHPFVISNEGNGPLEIEVLEISCKCTSADLAQGRKVEIKPGEKFPVKLSWHANSNSGVFRQAAKLATNDPRRPQMHLIVTGKVVKGVVVTPPFFHLVGLSTGQPYEGEIQVHSYRSKDFKVLGCELTGGSKPELFDISFEPTSVDEARYPGVLAAVKLKLKIKPGLPIGNVNQPMLVKTNDERKPELSLVAAGVIDGPVSLSGLNWIANESLLKLGAYSRADGYKTTLLMKIIDVDPAQLNPQVIKVVPSELKVTVGAARTVSSEGRTVVTYPLSVEIPPGGPVLTYLDTLQAPLGLIEIDTGHKETGILRMNVDMISVD